LTGRTVSVLSADPVDDLKANNSAWAACKVAADAGLFKGLEGQQAPKYLCIGCSDSRVPARRSLAATPDSCLLVGTSPIWRRSRTPTTCPCCNSPSMCLGQWNFGPLPLERRPFFSLDIQEKIGTSLPVAPRMFDLTPRFLVAAATGR